MNLGTDTGLARFIPHYLAERRWTEMRATVHIAWRPVAIATFVASVAVFGLADVIAPPLGLTDSSGPALLRIFAVTLPFASLSEFWLGLTRAFGRMRPSVFLENIGRTALQVVAILFAVALSTGIITLAIAWVVPYVITGSLAAVVGIRLIHDQGEPWSAPAEMGIGHVRREFWRYTWPRAISRVGQIALQRLDILLVAAILGPADAALYTAATRFVVLGQFASQAIQRVLLPRFSALVARATSAPSPTCSRSRPPGASSCHGRSISSRLVLLRSI